MKEEKKKSQRWNYSEEEEYFDKNRKENRMDRKLAKAKDRSKYKKTDQEKYLKGLEKAHEAKRSKEEWLEGKVITIISQGIIVSWEGQKIVCTLKGLLKKEKTLAKNLVAVGDNVLFQKTSESEGIIGHVKPRTSLLSRADNLSRKKEQLIAVNIDQVIITVSVVNPPLKCSIIDRYIIAAQKGGMEPIIVINKIDLLEQSALEEQKALYEEALQAYNAIDIPIIPVSIVEVKGIEKVIQIMTGKTSVFSGPSGVGKTSLVNAITGLDFRTGEVVQKTKKGSHTTSSTQFIELPFGGWCVDTPGIKSFGVWDLKPDEIEVSFTEIHEVGLGCKFSDCTHTQEEDCAVRAAVEEGSLSLLRYESYQSLMQSVNEQHFRR